MPGGTTLKESPMCAWIDVLPKKLKSSVYSKYLQRRNYSKLYHRV